MSSIVETYAAQKKAEAEEPQAIEQPIEDRPHINVATYYVVSYEQTTIRNGKFEREGGFVSSDSARFRWLAPFALGDTARFETPEKAQRYVHETFDQNRVLHLGTVKIYRVTETTKATLEPVPLP